MDEKDTLDVLGFGRVQKQWTVVVCQVGTRKLTGGQSEYPQLSQTPGLKTVRVSTEVRVP